MHFDNAEYWHRLEENCFHADEINRNNLMTLMRDNKDTAFGKANGFDTIDSIDEYRKRLPLTHYEPFRSYVDRMLDGQENVLTVYPVDNYCRTSGTEGVAKNIPVTSEAFRRYGNAVGYRQEEILNEFGGKRFIINTFRTDISGESTRDLLLSEALFRYLYENGSLDESHFAGGFKTLFSDSLGDRLFVKLWIGFAEADITVLESIFLYDLLIFFTYLEEFWEEVLSAMINRRIPECYKIPNEIRNYLLSLPVSNDRLTEVRTLCMGGAYGIAKKLWPDLKLVSGVSNRSYFTEDKTLRAYIGDVQYYYLAYCASECYMGTAVEDNDFNYVMMPETAFYEFLPVDGNETLLPLELEIGKCYKPVITNFSGLYRYVMEDILRVQGFLGKSPIFEFIMRSSQTLNIAGEKMDIHLVEKAVSELDGSNAISEWTIGIEHDIAPGRYFIAAVSAKGKTGFSPEISNLLDEKLTEYNPDYADLRQMDYIRRPQVLLLRPGSYGNFLKEIGLAGGHKKPNHVAVNGFTYQTYRKWVEEA
ncbi:MAG: GH3 auxin-responsive promoter family protein [Lachnospiraceae bacterium]|nr:GH3 auxin-responsive promoter family protein [Lachnospiraceae bacterium]